LDCHICKKPTSEFKHKKTNIIYYHCKLCEYIFKNPAYYQDFNTQKERYNLHENNVEDEGYIAYFKRFLEFILPLVGSPRNALDFGCGRTSLLATLLDKEGITCDYFDPIYHPDTLVKSKKYDLIVSTEVFEHLHAPQDVFKSLLLKLNNGGYLAIQTEFHANKIETFTKWWYPQDPAHIVFFRSQTFKVLCKQNGCRYINDNSKNIILIQKD
jgi:SAM-dependent methyltransferase